MVTVVTITMTTIINGERKGKILLITKTRGTHGDNDDDHEDKRREERKDTGHHMDEGTRGDDDDNDDDDYKR